MVFSDATAVAAILGEVQQHHALKVMSDEEREHSLNQMLEGWNGKTPIWVFAYGSLVWNPEFEFDAKRCVVVHGYHRSLCMWSKVWRGTPEKPGLVLALDKGGSCQGLAYRISPAKVRRELGHLWRREQVTGAYSPRWLNARGCGSCSEHGHELIRAIAFVARRDDPGYAGALDNEHLLQILRTASGANGSSADYLRATVHGLAQNGLADPHLERLVEQL